MNKVVAIVGRPNVGKSTLFNRLVGQRQAITAEEPGTTRDPVYGEVGWNGKYFLLVDTAGLGGESELTQQVEAQIHQVSALADVVLVVVDSSGMVTDQDLEAAKLALKTGKPIILALNKADIKKRDTDQFKKLGIKNTIEVSATHGTASGDLLDLIIKLLPKAPTKPSTNNSLQLGVVGRPNVGKSTLFNQLAGKPRAIVAEVAGTTRDINRTEIKYEKQLISIFDTAGFRRRGKIERGVEQFSILRTLAAINQADICVLVMDAAEPGSHIDQQVAGLVKEAGKGLILAVNKWDAIDKDDKTQGRMAAKLQLRFQFTPWAPLVFISALNGKHTDELPRLAIEIAERRKQQITEAKLKAYLREAIVNQPPAGRGNKHPKLTEIRQLSSDQPSFLIEGTNTKLLHFSYPRYLENRLRERFDFTGTPIRLVIKDKKL